MVSKRVRRAGVGVGVTVLILGGLIFLSRKTGAGNFIVDGLRGFGQTAGQALTAPITGLVSGARAGGQELFGEAGAAGADVQEAFTGNRNAIGDFFNNIFKIPDASAQTSTLQNDIRNLVGQIDSIQARPTAPPSTRRRIDDNAVDLSNLFSAKQIEQRITNAFRSNNPSVKVTLPGQGRDTSTGGFGGFGSATSQEIALRQAIEESRRNNPEFFT